MNLKEIEQLMDQVSLRHLRAIKAFQKGDEETATNELALLRDTLDDCLDREIEEAPEQQQNDEESKAGTEKKSDIDGSLHVTSPSTG